jgi:hypothetical protein
LTDFGESASYRFFVAPGAIFAMVPDAHYPKLPKKGRRAGRSIYCTTPRRGG